MPVGVVHIARARGKYNTVQPYKACYYVYGTFQCVGKYGNGMRKVPRRYFTQKQYNGEECNIALYANG